MGRPQIGWYNGWSSQERLATVPLRREAIRTGALAGPSTCSICGVNPQASKGNPVWLHDEDYARPLAAYQICRKCHRTLHDRFEYPEPWLELIARHGTGERWFEQLTMDPKALRQPFEETYPNGLPGI